jgi:hypothetical protein
VQDQSWLPGGGANSDLEMNDREGDFSQNQGENCSSSAATIQQLGGRINGIARRHPTTNKC